MSRPPTARRPTRGAIDASRSGPCAVPLGGEPSNPPGTVLHHRGSWERRPRWCKPLAYAVCAQPRDPPGIVCATVVLLTGATVAQTPRYSPVGANGTAQVCQHSQPLPPPSRSSFARQWGRILGDVAQFSRCLRRSARRDLAQGCHRRRITALPQNSAPRAARRALTCHCRSISGADHVRRASETSGASDGRVRCGSEQ
jgi:hypothetical protein